MNHVARRFGDPRKAAKLLRFRALIELETGLGKLVEWRTGMVAGKTREVARPDVRMWFGTVNLHSLLL